MYAILFVQEISDIATSQARLLEQQQVSRDKELLSVRAQLLDLQSASDEKALIGKLHRHIIQLQMSEGLQALSHSHLFHLFYIRVRIQLRTVVLCPSITTTVLSCKGTANRKLEEAHRRLAKYEAQILRLEQSLDTKEQFIYFNRLDATSKARHLKRNLQARLHSLHCTVL